MFTALSLDPGRTTGYAIAKPDSDKLLYLACGEATLDVEDLYDLMLAVRPTHIIYESFEYRGGQRVKVDLFPVQLIGIIRYYVACQGSEPPQVADQNAAMGKTFYTDTTLKNQEVYQKGLKHGRDAVRHLLHWWTFRGGYQYNLGQKVQLVDMRWLIESYLQVYTWKW